MISNFSTHTLTTHISDNNFLVYQPITRKGVIIEKNFFMPNSKEYLESKFFFEDISTFSLSETLVANPNGLVENFEQIKLTKKESKSFIIDLLKKYSIISNNPEDYFEILRPKESFFDKKHTGNFHQQIGDFLFQNQRKNSEDWWIFQKFSPDIENTVNNAYNWVQENFIKSFFNKKLLNKKNVLDFGCGVGYYSSFFSKMGAIVDAVDPSKHLIDIAKSKFSENESLNFFTQKFEEKIDFKFFKKKYDIIFMSDVFLYYFVPYNKHNISAYELINQLASLLTIGGKIYIIDPHGIFHLQPWFNNKFPYVILTEYVNRKYRVTPSLEEVSHAVEKAGLVISKIREIKYEGIDTDKTFYNEFPFWWFFELSK